MNKKLFYPALAAMAITMLTACDNDDLDDAPKHESPYSLYVLNEGSWGKNNASISAITRDQAATAVSDIYSLANSRGLGDVAQDLVYDDDTHCLFVSVSESRYIAKLDDQGRELMRYSTTTSQAQPRYLVLEDGFLYASMYGGMVAKLDTATLSVISTVNVGAFPEQMAEEEGLLAVCNSGYGEGNTLSVIDLRSFQVVKQVELPHKNPQHIVGCNDRFYCNTTEYDANWNSVSNIVEVNPSDWSTRDITEGFYLTEGDNKVYIVQQAVNYYTSPYTYTNTFKTYDTQSGKLGNEYPSAAEQAALADQGIYGITYDDDNDCLYVCVNRQEGTEYVNSLLYSYDRTGQKRFTQNVGILAKKVVVCD